VSIEGETPFFQHAVDLGLFDQPIFTIYMKPDSASDVDVPVKTFDLTLHKVKNFRLALSPLVA
jgi:hypothetical protein